MDFKPTSLLKVILRAGPTEVRQLSDFKARSRVGYAIHSREGERQRAEEALKLTPSSPTEDANDEEGKNGIIILTESELSPPTDVDSIDTARRLTAKDPPEEEERPPSFIFC